MYKRQVWENLQRDLAYDPEEKRVIHLKDVGEVRQKCENER